MNVKPMAKKVLFSSLILVGLPAFAQNVAQNPYGSCTSYVECAKSMATQDQIDLQKKIDENSAKGAQYEICLADELMLQQNYNSWFTQHQVQFEKIDKAVKEGIANANVQLKQVRDEAVTPMAVKGQDNLDKTITLDDLVAYFADLNTRLKGKSESDRAIILKQNEDPRFNLLRISHKQALDTLKILTEAMNASLRELNANFEIGFSPESEDYLLEVRVQIKIMGVNQTFHASIPAAGKDLQITEESLWQSVISSGVKIDNHPVDGAARYRMMQVRDRQASCKSSWKKIPASSGLPFVLYKDLSSVAPVVVNHERIAKPVALPSGTISSISSSVGGDLFAVVNGQVERMNPSGSWELVGMGGLKHTVTDVAITDAGTLYGVDTDRSLYEYNNVSRSWKQLSSSPIHEIRGSVDGGVYGLNLDNQLVYSRKDLGIQIASKKEVGGFVGTINKVVYALDKKGNVVKVINRQTEEVIKSEGVDSEIVQAIVIENEVIIALTKRGTIYEMTESASGNHWKKVLASKSPYQPYIEIVAGSDGKIFALQSDGKVFVIQ